MNAITSFGNILQNQIFTPLVQARQYLFQKPPDIAYDSNLVPTDPLEKIAYKDTKISGVSQIFSAAKTTILNLHEYRDAPVYKQLSDFAYWSCDTLTSASQGILGESSPVSEALKFTRDIFSTNPDATHRQHLYNVASLPEAAQNAVVSFRIFTMMRDNWIALQQRDLIADAEERSLFAQTASLNLGANIFTGCERFFSLLPAACTLAMGLKFAGLPLVEGWDIGPEDQLAAMTAALAFRIVNNSFSVLANRSQLKLSRRKEELALAQDEEANAASSKRRLRNQAMADKAFKNFYFRLSTLGTQILTGYEACQRFFDDENAKARIADTLRVISVNAHPHFAVGIGLFLLQGAGSYRNLVENLDALQEGHLHQDPVHIKSAHLGCWSAIYQIAAALLTPFPCTNNIAVLLARQAGQLNTQRQSLEEWHKNRHTDATEENEAAFSAAQSVFSEAK